MCFPDFCFSNRKACDLCSPENLSGDHRKHRGKCENSGFSPALQMDQFSLKISPKNKKTDQRSGRRRIEKWSGWWGSNPRLSAPKADALSHCATPRFLWRFYTITPDFTIVKAENRESMLFLPFSTVEAKCQFQNRVNPQHLFRNLMRIQHQLRP